MLYECPLCKIRYDSVIGLNNHWVRTHKETSEKLYRILNNLPLDQKNLCACGCKEEARYLGIERGYTEYVRGHSSRVHNNWGNNPKALENSINTRREMLKEGTWKPFVSLETGEHWALGLTKENSPIIAKKVEKLLNDPIAVKRMSDRWKEYWATGKFTIKYGPEHSQWKGGVSSLKAYCRNNKLLYEHWKYPILCNAHFACEKCHKNKKVVLDIHHNGETMASIVKKVAIENNWLDIVDMYKDDPLKLLEAKHFIGSLVAQYHIDNKVSGIVLCRECHMEEHNSYNFHRNKSSDISEDHDIDLED
jgi:hypothetical protein